MRTLIADTETTGIHPNRTLRLERMPEIIEFYGHIVDLDRGVCSEEINQLIKPKTAVDEGSKAHKKVQITNAMLEQEKGFAFYAAEIKALIESADMFITHNISFDTEIIEIEYQRLAQVIYWPRRLCTVEQTVHLKGYRLSLSNLHEYLFGEKFEGAHRAKVDVEALTRCCIELRRRKII